MSLWKLALLIALFNLMTFGNGPVMIPLLHTHLVEGARILTEDQLLYAFTIARVTPGQANFYVVSIGYMLYGITGAIVATLAIILPGYIMIPLLHGYEHLLRGADSGRSRSDRSRRTDSAGRVGRTARDARHDATAQVEHTRGAGSGNLPRVAA